MVDIILDLEATCWPSNSGRTQEIIEIGALKLDKYGNIISDFKSFVRPNLFNILSDYCKELTGITQEEINSAPFFAGIFPKFLNWIIETGLEYRIWSWGLYDRKQFNADCEEHQLKTDWLDGKHYNLKKEFQKARTHRRQVGMKKALNILNLKLEGSHHRAFDDAINISKIFNMDRDVYLKNSTPSIIPIEVQKEKPRTFIKYIIEHENGESIFSGIYNSIAEAYNARDELKDLFPHIASDLILSQCSLVLVNKEKID